MEYELQKKLVEAILFLKEEPIKVEKIAEIISLPRAEAEQIVQELQEEFVRSGRGLQIFQVAGGYQMGTLPELAPYLEKMYSEEVASNLSNAAMETLAIIAYKQPVTRMEIESVRGVKCDHVLDNLLKRKLIRISGRKEGPGRPFIYCTTPDFLRYFGLKDLEELPALEEEKPTG